MDLCVIIHYDLPRPRNRCGDGCALPTCGAVPVSETICPDCGERNAGRVEFCASCGAFLAWDGPGDQDQQPPAGRDGPDRAGPSGHTRSGPVPGLLANPGASPSARPAATGPTGHQTRSFNDPGAASGPSTSGGPRTVGPSVPARPPGSPSGPATGLHAAQQFGAQQVGPATGRYPTGGTPYPSPLPAAALPPTESPCPRCGVVNAAALRFCRKCGLSLKSPTLHDDGLGRPEPPAERLAWWRRWFRPAPNTRRAARAAYRHSLPLRYRLLRWVFALLGIGALVGGLTLIGQNPVGWVTARINDLQGSLVQVQGVQAYGEPAAGTTGSGTATATTALPAPDSASNVLDNLSDTAWATAWSAQSQLNPAAAPCVPPSTPSAAGSPGSVLLVPANSLTVREISVAAGLSKDDSRRMLQWRPRTVQLAFSDGRCQQITLTDTDELQQHAIEPVQTTQIRLSVVDAYPPATDQPIDEVAISEIRLFQRP
jgi:hypothetical protein